MEEGGEEEEEGREGSKASRVREREAGGRETGGCPYPLRGKEGPHIYTLHPPPLTNACCSGLLASSKSRSRSSTMDMLESKRRQESAMLTAVSTLSPVSTHT